MAHFLVVLQKTFCFALCVVFFFTILLSYANAESINDFTADFQVNKDGTVLVTEVITYDFGPNDRHGIFRILKHQHPQSATVWYKKRFIDIDLLSVQIDGGGVPYEVSESSGETTVKVGDPDVTIQGVHTYTISYLLSGALSYGTEGAELYYNVTGNAWEVPIARVTANVRGEQSGMFGGKAECYRGGEGSVLRCEKSSTENKAVFASEGLSAYEGLTIAQELNIKNVTVLIYEQTAVYWLGYVLGTLWLFGLCIWAYRYRTAFKSKQPVIAQYEPYEGILPMYTGVLFDGKLDPRDITAGIVYLAEQGFIKIRKTEEKVLWVFNTTDYEITLLKSMKDLPVSINLTVLELFFGNYAEAGSKMQLSDLPSHKQTENVALIQTLKSSFTNDLISGGFIVSTFILTLKRQSLIIWSGLVVLLLISITTNLPFFAGLFFVLLTVVILFIAFNKRRTQKGYDAINHLKGFKLFLSVTDTERFAFHNAPEKSPELFMKYLPYAIALGVDEKWQNAFKDITIPKPDWYDGGSIGAFSAGAFSTADLTSDLGAFSNAVASSGVSGSSGGGSSGGGGGGGGGGSW